MRKLKARLNLRTREPESNFQFRYSILLRDVLCGNWELGEVSRRKLKGEVKGSLLIRKKEMTDLSRFE